MLSRDLLREALAEARLAPSVHNVQPSRWRLAGDRLELLGDTARALPVADPNGRDWRLSHGAHLEGMALALAARGLGLVDLRLHAASAPGPDDLVPIADCGLAPDAGARTAEPVATRVSWRGSFRPSDAEDRAGLARLATKRDDCLLVNEPGRIAEIAALADRAALHFLRDEAHRAELLHWLRLSRAHPSYRRDGLTADAMAMSPIEAWGAGLVLGPLFRPLDRIGLAAPLVSDRAKTASAAAIALFHRPVGEDPLLSGRAFYRAWLAMESCGLRGCPVSVLVDWDVSREALVQNMRVPPGRQLVNVFRIGRPAGTPSLARARLPVDELIV